MTRFPPALGLVLLAAASAGCPSSSNPPGTGSSGSASGAKGSASAASGITGSSSGSSDAAGVSGSSGTAAGATGTSSGAGGSGSAASGTGMHDAGGDSTRDAAAPTDAARTDSAPNGGPDAAAHSGAWRITPLGDSITGETCGPQLLSQELIHDGHTQFTFVGTVTNDQSCSGAPNVASEGHGGYLVTDLLPAPHVPVMQDHSSELPMWASSDKPDVVLMQFGTNDVWNSVATQTILSAYSLVFADFRAVSPNAVFFVAQITPLNPSGCTNCEQQVEALNAAIPAWAASQSTAASPVYVVDVWSAFTASTYLPNSTYTSDGVHPNQAGSALVAQKWYDALVARNIP